MRAGHAAPAFEIRRNYRRALMCMPALRNPVKHNAEILELVMAMAGPSFQRAYEDFCTDENGKRLLAERPDLLERLLDDDYLRSLPNGSLGHAYLDFMRTNRLDAGLYTETHRIPEVAKRLGWDEQFAWVVQRGLILHDLLHALGGYGPDIAGEIAALGFTHGQAPNVGTVIVAGLAYVLPVGVPKREIRRLWKESVARSRNAALLMAQPYEELLELPLDDVRRRLEIAPTAEAHPNGLPYSTFRFGARKKDFVYDDVFDRYTYDPQRDHAA